MLEDGTFWAGLGCNTSHACMLPLQDVAAELPAAKQLFEHASDVLGYDLLKVCVEGMSSALLSLSS